MGELSGGWLAMAGSGAAGVLWYAGEQQTPAGIAPRLVSKDAWTALREGQVGQDGVITWNGRGFRLADVCEGDQLVARLVAAT